ncbi:MAG: PAS domain S-box protein, partial [Humidesulfovibrio sp.]|nr:PAS domain S-box protein [Humidesulfovibrio sp.]
MRSSFFHSLTFRLGLLALIALAPVILAAGFLDRDFRQHLNSVALQDAQNQSDHVAAQGREILAGSRQMIFALSRLPEMRRPVASRISDLLRDIVRQSPHYSVCILFNSRGDFIASSAPEVQPFSAFDRPWFQTVRETLACTQGEFLVSRCSGDPVITQGCPVLDPAGRLVGALAIGTRFDWLQQIGAALALPPNSSVCVVDAKGDISAHFPERTTEHAKYIPDSRAVMNQVRQGQTIIQELGQDGVRRIYAYSILSSQPGRELYVRVGIPVASIFAPAAASGKRNALALLAAAVLSLLGAGLVARTILGPAGAMLKGLRELGAGNLSFRVNSKARGELGEVAKAVDAMAEALQLSHASLRSSEQRLRQFLEDVPVSYFVSSVEGRFLEANPAHLRMLGYDSLEQMQAEITDISRQFYVGPKNRALLLEALHTIGCVFQVEHEIYRRDGTTIWAALTARALRNEAGDIIGVQGFSTDITARRQAEMQLQRSNERFLRVLENQADAIFVTDAETDMVLFANDAVHRVMGRDVLGRPCWEAVRGGRAQCGKCPRLALLDEDGEPSGVHTREEHDQASGTWVLVRVQAIRWVDGRLARLETITDITDIKRVQEGQARAF